MKGERLKQKIGEVKLRAGDVLLLDTGWLEVLNCML